MAQAEQSAAANTNLIEDLTDQMARSPIRKLEQLVDLDEEQVANILKQWLTREEAAWMAVVPPVWDRLLGHGVSDPPRPSLRSPRSAWMRWPPQPPDLEALAAAARDEAAARARHWRSRPSKRPWRRNGTQPPPLWRRRGSFGWKAESAILASTFTARPRPWKRAWPRALRGFCSPSWRRPSARGDWRPARNARVHFGGRLSGTLDVTGGDLVAALARRRTCHPGGSRWIPTAALDVRIRTNGTVIETRLKAWGGAHRRLGQRSVEHGPPIRDHHRSAGRPRRNPFITGVSGRSPLRTS